MIGPEIRIRPATQSDASEIILLLIEVAPEIPLRLDTEERKVAGSKIVGECVGSGESWVAVDAKCRVVGFVLLQADKMKRFLNDNQALHIRYAGVAKRQRKRGVFCALIQHAMSRNVPLTATVKAANQSGMAARLARLGFQECTTSSRDEKKFQWQPHRLP